MKVYDYLKKKNFYGHGGCFPIPTVVKIKLNLVICSGIIFFLNDPSKFQQTKKKNMCISS